MISILILDFILFFVFFTCADLSVLSKAARNNPSALSKPECLFPLLSDRLIRMINYKEPFAFEVILHSECRGNLDSAHPKYIKLFRTILKLAKHRDMTSYLDSIMKDEAYDPSMFLAWITHRPLLPLKYIQILRSRFKHSEGSMIFSLSLEYPQNSLERGFLNAWLVKLQRSTLNWPFTPETISPLSRSPQTKSKSLKPNPLSWGQFQDVPGISGEGVKSGASDELNIRPEERKAESSIPATLPTPTLNFGHIYGWVSRNGNAIVGNSNKAFNFYGHTVKLHNTFLGFASSKFDLQTYAESAQTSKSFFAKPNSALFQRIRSKSGKNFAACRLKSGSDGFELQAILKGDLTLVVLGALPSSGVYDYKYPDPSQSYDELLRGSRELRSIIVPISPSDIVLFIPRTIFSDPDLFIHPHDVPGAFMYTDLLTFATSFVQFINFVHHKTNRDGLLAVGGFVHENNND